MTGPRRVPVRGVISMCLLVGAIVAIVLAGRLDLWPLSLACIGFTYAAVMTHLGLWSLPVRVTERLFGPLSWPHQIAQVVVTGLGCAGAWRWYGWQAAAIVATIATAVSCLAAFECKKMVRRERERMIKLAGVRVDG